jgi:UDP:flavonoid glycosyltransferase YjiC (YdhE family)
LRYLSQALVLPHCTAVVSHCGAGTMFGALSFGLPQLCLPQGTDQPFNALAVAGAGAGVVLNPDQVTADAVADGLDRVLGDPAVRSAALRLRAQIADMPEPADALRLLIDRTRG